MHWGKAYKLSGMACASATKKGESVHQEVRCTQASSNGQQPRHYQDHWRQNPAARAVNVHSGPHGSPSTPPTGTCPLHSAASACAATCADKRRARTRWARSDRRPAASASSSFCSVPIMVPSVAARDSSRAASSLSSTRARLSFGTGFTAVFADRGQVARVRKPPLQTDIPHRQSTGILRITTDA